MISTEYISLIVAGKADTVHLHRWWWRDVQQTVGASVLCVYYVRTSVCRKLTLIMVTPRSSESICEFRGRFVKW